MGVATFEKKMCHSEPGAVEKMKKNRNQDGSFQKKNGHFSPRQITLRDGHFCQKRCHLGTILAWVPLCHISKISVSFSNRKWCQDGTFSEKNGHPQMEDRGGRGPEERGGRGPGANEVVTETDAPAAPTRRSAGPQWGLPHLKKKCAIPSQGRWKK